MHEQKVLILLTFVSGSLQWKTSSCRVKENVSVEECKESFSKNI